MKQIKIMVEKHSDGYVAYPLGLKGVIVGEGDTYEEVLANVESAIESHLEAFGEEAFDIEEIIEDLWLESQCDNLPQ